MTGTLPQARQSYVGTYSKAEATGIKQCFEILIATLGIVPGTLHMLGKCCPTEPYPWIPWLFEARSCYVAQAGLEPVMLLPDQVPPNAEITSQCHPTQLEPMCLKPFLCQPLGHRKKNELL